MLTSREVINDNNNNKEEDNSLIKLVDLAVAVGTAAVKAIITNNIITIIITNILTNNNILQLIPMLTI